MRHHHFVERVVHEKHILLGLNRVAGGVRQHNLDPGSPSAPALEDLNVPSRDRAKLGREFHAHDLAETIERSQQQHASFAGPKVHKAPVAGQIEAAQQRPQWARLGCLVAHAVNTVLAHRVQTVRPVGDAHLVGPPVELPATRGQRIAGIRRRRGGRWIRNPHPGVRRRHPVTAQLVTSRRKFDHAGSRRR